MVGIMIVDGKVEVDPLGTQDVHPAAELFPLMVGTEFDELVADIKAHGLREAIVYTPNNQLLDGRNRWRACDRAGVTPITRIETSEPWAYVLSTNVHRRHLTDSQRAMIAARIALRKRGGQLNPRYQGFSDPQPPTQAQAAELLNISDGAITAGRAVRREGSAALVEAVETNAIPIYTAARIARSMPTDQQDDFVRRVAQGSDPVRLAAKLDVPTVNPRRPGPARTDNHSPHRHRHLGLAALENMRDSLQALDLVMRSVDGLDPAITSEEAARLAGDLSKTRGVVSRVVKLLKEREETTP